MTDQLMLLTLRWVELSRDGNTMEDGGGWNYPETETQWRMGGEQGTREDGGHRVIVRFLSWATQWTQVPFP